MSETETVSELTSEMSGVWLVTTQGSTHIWDLDAWTYERRPGKERGQFVGDFAPQPIWCVKRFPKVGESFYVELDESLTQIQFRISTEVVSIERYALPAADNES